MESQRHADLHEELMQFAFAVVQEMNDLPGDAIDRDRDMRGARLEKTATVD